LGEIKDEDQNLNLGFFKDGHLEGEVLRIDQEGKKSRVFYEEGSEDDQSSEELSSGSK
jgi:hypothetical protein